MSKSVMPMRWSSSCRRGEPEASTIFAMAAPSLSGGAEAAPVGTVQMLHFGEGQPGLVFHDAELADPGVFLNGHIPGGVGGIRHWSPSPR